MYRTIRNTHLIIGMFSLMFVLMYGISSAQMSHQWNTGKPAATTAETALAVGLDARAAARALMDRGAVRGEMMQARQEEALWKFRVQRPGTVYEVAYDGGSGVAKVTTNVAGTMAMLNRLHHVGGLWHEYALTQVWSIVLLAVSIGLAVLAGTGIYMWFALHSERIAGGVILAVHLAVSLGLLAMIRAA